MDNQETHPGVDTEHHGARRRALLGAGLGGAALSLLPFLSGRAAAASDSTVATTTAASGFSPARRHLMSQNFSAPKSAPKPASVMA